MRMEGAVGAIGGEPSIMVPMVFIPSFRQSEHDLRLYGRFPITMLVHPRLYGILTYINVY